MVYNTDVLSTLPCGREIDDDNDSSIPERLGTTNYIASEQNDKTQRHDIKIAKRIKPKPTSPPKGPTRPGWLLKAKQKETEARVHQKRSLKSYVYISTIYVKELQVHVYTHHLDTTFALRTTKP